MPFENKRLLEFLEEVDKVLAQKITIIAVGGTAMTLLNLKTSTIDIDFEVSGQEGKILRKALDELKPGFRVDVFSDGLIFSQLLPPDFRKKAIPVKTKFKNIQLFALHPVDIVSSKIGRLNARDEQDIQSCIKIFKLTKKQIEKRGKQIEYVGHEGTYESNLKFVIENFF